MQIARVNASLTATAKGFKEAFSENGKAVKGFASDVDQASKKVAGASGGFKQLKSSLGEESGLGNFAKILAGTGAVAGLALLGRTMEAVSAKALELSAAFNSGKISTAELQGELLKAIPVLGNFAAAYENIFQLYTGQAAAEKQALEVEKKIIEQNKQRTLAYKNYRDSIWDIGTAMKRLQLTGIDGTIFDIDQATADAVDRIRQNSEGLSKDRLDKIIEMRRQLGEMQKESARAADSFAKAGAGDVSGILGKFIKDTTQAGNDILNNERARQFAESQKQPQAFTDPGGPQLLQSGSQEAASFVARMQREQAAKENDPSVKVQKKVEVNTSRTATAMEKLANSIAVLT